MKIYPKIFESVFSEDKREKLVLSEVSTEEIEVDEYVDIFKSTFREFSVILFSFYVKIIWLRSKFCYKNKKISFYNKKNSDLNTLYAFSRFVRRKVGSDTQFLTQDWFFPKVCSYFSELFPDFHENNPFDNPELYNIDEAAITEQFLSSTILNESLNEETTISDEEIKSYLEENTDVNNIINEL